MLTDLEKRVFETDPLEFRASDGDGVGGISGYAAVFNRLSVNLGGFREQIAPGAFDGRMNDDVRALFNHDPNRILGRNRAGTLDLKVDKVGLRYTIDPLPESAADLAEAVSRGDVDQSSFAFTVEEDEWEEDDEGRIIRTIIKVRQLYDVSPVTYPGYEDTSVSARSLSALEAYSQRKEAILREADERRRALDLILTG